MAGVLNMVVEADKFHLQVAKALLSSKPPSEQQRVALRDLLAKRERTHEQIEASLAEMKRVLGG